MLIMRAAKHLISVTMLMLLGCGGVETESTEDSSAIMGVDVRMTRPEAPLTPAISDQLDTPGNSSPVIDTPAMAPGDGDCCVCDATPACDYASTTVMDCDGSCRNALDPNIGGSNKTCTNNPCGGGGGGGPGGI